MESYKKSFIELMIKAEVLTFGDFITKSGRKTPYFINSGNYKTAEQIKKLGDFYSYTVQEQLGFEFDVLFGPAYKGIPLVITTAMALLKNFNKDVSFCFNRKEVKNHGEGGTLIGHIPQSGDRVLIIEDVTTAGTSIRETIPLLQKHADIALAGLIISVDRLEVGYQNKSALRELEEEFNMPTKAIVTIDDVVTYLYNREINGEVIINEQMKKKIDNYRNKYGVR